MNMMRSRPNSFQTRYPLLMIGWGVLQNAPDLSNLRVYEYVEWV